MNQTKENTEPLKNPWSIKGIKPNNREAAKQIAGENGLTIGEWINNLIEEADSKSDSEKALLQALDNQPISRNEAEIQKPKAESLRDIYKQYSSNQNEAQDIGEKPQNIGENPLSGNAIKDVSTSPFFSKADDMNQPENLGINYDDMPKAYSVQNETSRLALAMEMLNRKLETVAQPVAFAQPAAVPFVQPAPIANNNAYAPIPLVGGDRNVESLARRLEDGEARIERKNERIANTLEDLKEAQNTINEKLRRIESNDNNQRTIHSLQALETSLDSIMRQLSDTNLRTTRIEQDLVSEKSNRLTPADVEKILEKSVNEINSSVATEFSKFNTRLANVEDFNNKALEHTEKTNASMRDALVELSARLANLEGDDNERIRQDIESRISSLIGRISDIEDNIESIVAKTQAEAQEKYSGIIRELNDRIEANERGTVSAIENIGNKLVSTAESMDRRIREIEDINANAKDSHLAMQMEIGKLSSAIDERLNDLESGSSTVVNQANAHLNTIAEQLNTRLSVFESRSRELEDRIKKQENVIEQRFESAHEDISELIGKNTAVSNKLIDDKLSIFETRLSAAQDMAQSITKPLHETLVDLVERLENMELGNKNNVYSEAIKPSNYSYQLSPSKDAPSDIKLAMIDEAEEPSQDLVIAHEEEKIPDAHIDAVSMPLEMETITQEEVDPFGMGGFASADGHDALASELDSIFGHDKSEKSEPHSEIQEFEVPEYSVPEYEVPLSDALNDSENAALEEALKAPKDFKIPSEGRLFASEEKADDTFIPDNEDSDDFNFFNETTVDENDFIRHEDGDFDEDVLGKITEGKNNDDLTLLSEFEGDYNPNTQELLQNKTYEFDNELHDTQNKLQQERKPFGQEYLEKARNAAMSAADEKGKKQGNVKKKPMAASSKPGSEKANKSKQANPKEAKLAKLYDLDAKHADHKPVVSPLGVALAGVLVASGAYAGYNYLQQQKVVKTSSELPAAIKNHEPVTNGQIAAPASTEALPVAATAAQSPTNQAPTNQAAVQTPANTEAKPQVAIKPETSVTKAQEVKPITSEAKKTDAKKVEAKKVSSNAMPAIATATNQPAAKTVYGQALALEQAGNFKGAAEIYVKAASAGDTRAMNKLSKMFERGQGVPKDIKKAKALTEQAALAGSRQAQHNLGVYYADGEGGEKNYAKAADNFRKAAKRGMTDSQFNLGAMAERGIGTDKNPKEAYYWYSLAAKSGDADAKSHAQDLASKLSAADKTETDRRINTFRPEQGGYE